MLNTHRLVNIGLAFTIAATLATAYLLDGPTLAQTDADVTADIAAAKAQARAAAAESCGGDVTHCQPAYKRQAAQQVAAK